MGKKSHDDNVYYKSKGNKLRKKTYNDNPIKGYPNTYIDFYDIFTGKMIRRRVLGNYGVAIKDYDEPHITHNKKIHIHNWLIKNGGFEKQTDICNLTKKDKNMFKKMRKKKLKKGNNNEKC